jgi:hypothetical protein
MSCPKKMTFQCQHLGREKTPKKKKGIKLVHQRAKTYSCIFGGRNSHFMTEDEINVEKSKTRKIHLDAG